MPFFLLLFCSDRFSIISLPLIYYLLKTTFSIIIITGSPKLTYIFFLIICNLFAEKGILFSFMHPLKENFFHKYINSYAHVYTIHIRTNICGNIIIEYTYLFILIYIVEHYDKSYYARKITFQLISNVRIIAMCLFT